MSVHLKLLSVADSASNFSVREGETKLGQKVHYLDDTTTLSDAVSQGKRYGLIGIPEQIGPMANHGKGGAQSGWQAFLSIFLNLQSNRFMDGTDIVVVGEVACEDLNQQALASPTIEQLRVLCQQLDDRVEAALQQIFRAGLVPIIIGGGHNNAFPIIKACYQHQGLPLAVANLDPHSDFRPLEGRHSGNPFSYAAKSGALGRYAVLGLHEQKNSEHALAQLKLKDFIYHTVQQSHWRRELSFDQCIANISKYLHASGLPVGIELDLDAISEMPTSAITSCGVTIADAIYYVVQMSQLPEVQYLHLAEAAPERHPAGEAAGKRVVGQALAELVCAFIKTQNARTC
jgi:formiminoglutamase